MIRSLSIRSAAAFAALSIVALLTFGSAGRSNPPVRTPSPARELNNKDLLLEPVPEHTRYYILIFGSQATPKRPRYTHTWATMVKTYEKPGETRVIGDIRTISWMPASGVIRPLRFRVEPGCNLDMGMTIAEVQNDRERVSLWGPYETWHGFYRRFVTQSEFLNRGAIGYQCIDSWGEAGRCGNGSNCFHALSDMDPDFDRRQYPLFFYGNAASANIVRQISTRPVLIRPQTTHDWLISELGLCERQLIRKHYRGPVVEFSPDAISRSR